jgi:hypothetical protein
VSNLLGSLFVKIAVDQEAFDKSLQNGESKFKAFSKGMTEKGKQLTASVTLPILAIGTALVKVASDAEETRNKFNTAFRGIEGRASTTAKALADGYGLARAESEKLLANTGDLLKGFGATADEALDLSFEVQKLAADLGSYNNLPTEQASQAITSALLGEREALKSLGVVVSEEAVKRQLALDGTSELTGELLLQAKAQATLKLITAQSGDAIGDFARSSDSVANTTKALVADFQNLAVELGQELLPIAKDILDFARGAIKGFSELSAGNKQLIITLAGIAAAAGPVLTAIGSIGTALGFLAANPMTLTIAALAAVVAGLYAVGLAVDNANLERMRDRFTEIGEESGRAAEEMEAFVQSAAKLDKFLFKGFQNISGETIANDLEGYRAKLQEIADTYGLSYEEVLKLGVASDYLGASAANVLQAELDTYVVQQKQQALADQQALARLAGAKDAENRAAQEEKRIERARLAAEQEQKILERQKEQAEILKNTYLEARQEVLGILENEKTEYQKLEEQILRLEQTKWASGQLEDDRLAAIEALRARQQQIVDEEEQYRIDSEQRIADEKIRQIELVDAADEAAWKDFKDRAKEREEEQRRLTNQIVDSFQEFLGSLDSLGDALAEAEIARVQESVDAQEITQEQADKKIRKIKRKQAEDDKKLAIFNTLIDTSQAIVGFLSNPGGYPGIALSVLAGITGAAQIGAVAAQPLPALAEGGFFNGPALIGEAGREFAFPLDGPQGQNAMELMANQLSKAMSKGGSVSNNSTINFSSTFDLGNEATKRKAAREIFPFIVEEQKRRGIA